MNIGRVEQLSEKGVGSLNEDQVLVNPSHAVFGVFDGATSLVPYLSPDGKTGAYLASSIAKETFTDSSRSLAETALEANRRIEEAHHQAGIDVSNSVGRFGTTAAVAKILENSAELLQIGDSIIIVVSKDGKAQAPLVYQDHDLEIMRKWRVLANEKATNIRETLHDDVIALRGLANSTYGVLNGDINVNNFLNTTTVDLGNTSTILILSDGMYLPKSDPDKEENWDQYARLYQEGGLKKIFQLVREMEDSDPEIHLYPRYKLHDDASGVAINLFH